MLDPFYIWLKYASEATFQNFLGGGGGGGHQLEGMFLLYPPH